MPPEPKQSRPSPGVAPPSKPKPAPVAAPAPSESSPGIALPKAVAPPPAGSSLADQLVYWSRVWEWFAILALVIAGISGFAAAVSIGSGAWASVIYFASAAVGMCFWALVMKTAALVLRWLAERSRRERAGRA